MRSALICLSAGLLTLLNSSAFAAPRVVDLSACSEQDNQIINQARSLSQRKNWTQALATLKHVSETCADQHPTRFALAQAQVGRCGADQNIFEGIARAGHETLFENLMEYFKGARTTQLHDCLQAEHILKSFGEPVEREREENTLMVQASLGELGVILAVVADANGDGRVDHDFKNCLMDGPSVYGPTAISNLLAAASANEEISSRIDLFPLSEACELLSANNPSYNFCSVTERQNITRDMFAGFKTMVGTFDQVKIGLKIKHAPQPPQAVCF